MSPIILLDLDNALQLEPNPPRPVIFRREIVDLVRPFNVHLLSGVHESHRKTIMAELERQTSWRPAAAHFTTSFAPSWMVKKRYFTDIIEPRYPDAAFIAIEFDSDTIREFQLLGITCLTVVPEYRPGRPRTKPAYMNLPE